MSASPKRSLLGAHAGDRNAVTNAAEHVSELIVRCKAGDQSAMADLVDRFRAQVFGLCFRMLGHRQDAEDMAQESFARALRSLGRWDSAREFTPWLLAIAGNRCRTLLAARGRRPRMSSEVESVPDRRPDPHAARRLGEEVKLALARLREEHRTAFLLFHVDELSYVEIAEALSAPVGTIKTWIHRARREMASFLRDRGVSSEATHAMRGI